MMNHLEHSDSAKSSYFPSSRRCSSASAAKSNAKPDILVLPNKEDEVEKVEEDL